VSKLWSDKRAVTEVKWYRSVS